MILERTHELARLGQLLGDTGTSGGRVILVRGEAGIGKSSLVAAFQQDCAETAHVLFGSCDDLLTARPYGPFADMARSSPDLADAIKEGQRSAVTEAVFELLSRKLRPTVMIIEDTQWADEATLDLIKVIGRRVQRLNGLLILTYRDEEVDSEHPLRQVFGELPAQAVVRMTLAPLSADAVAELAGGRTIDVDKVLALTGGNPLFVTEVLASESGEVPASVTDAVLARAAKMSPHARELLDFVSVVPTGIELSLVEKVIDLTPELIDEGLRQGLLATDGVKVSFRHDLQRRAIESTLSPIQKQEFNGRIVEALLDTGDAARIAHHAREAGNVPALIEFAPKAAALALALESTTEAIGHFESLAPYLDQFDVETQAQILEDWGRMAFYAESGACVDLLDRSIAMRRAIGDLAALARTLTFAGRVNKTRGMPSQAIAYVSEAVEILSDLPPSPDLVTALSDLAYLKFAYFDADDDVLPAADQAIAVAEEIGDKSGLIDVYSVVSQLRHSRGEHQRGARGMEEALALAQRSNDRWRETGVLAAIASMAADERDLSRAMDYSRRAEETAARYEIRSIEVLCMALRSEYLLWTGDWVAAENLATSFDGISLQNVLLVDRVLATIQVRRGTKEARSAVDRLWAAADATGGISELEPPGALVAEYLWLSGDDPTEFEPRLLRLLDEGLTLGAPWPSGAFAFWMWKLGYLDHAPPGTADFYGWILKGEPHRSAEFWRSRRIPYEEGLALMHGDTDDQLEAVRIFDDLGANATAKRVRRMLSDRGVKAPRGKSKATKNHAAGLTARQAEVLDLLAKNYSNIEIADELFVSTRTVENHVSAVLMKLDVPTRELAVKEAEARGILATAQS